MDVLLHELGSHAQNQSIELCLDGVTLLCQNAALSRMQILFLIPLFCTKYSSSNSQEHASNLKPYGLDLPYIACQTSFSVPRLGICDYVIVRTEIVIL